VREKDPTLGAFFLVTLMPQVPIIIYFLLGQENLPMDYAVNIIMAIFLLPQIVISFIALRKLIKSQNTKYYLQTYRFREEPRDDDDDDVL